MEEGRRAKEDARGKIGDGRRWVRGEVVTPGEPGDSPVHETTSSAIRHDQ